MDAVREPLVSIYKCRAHGLEIIEHQDGPFRDAVAIRA